MGIVKRIRELERDLSARTVVREKVSHYVLKFPRGLHGDDGRHENPGDWMAEVIDVPEESVPNTEKRESAIRELKEIYRGSNWYQFVRKYLAGRTLKGRS